MSEWAEPKPEQETVRVRKSARIVEIKCEEDESTSFDEVNDTLELIAALNVVDDENDPPLEGAEVTCYRSVTARLNYIGPDRVDVQYAEGSSSTHGETASIPSRWTAQDRQVLGRTPQISEPL